MKLAFLFLLFTLLLADKDRSPSPLPSHAVPTLHCYLTEKAPTIDGKLDEFCWKQGEVAMNFQQLGLRGTAGEQTKAMVTYDAENLYIGFICFESNMSGIYSAQTQRDGPLWLDDCIEVFLDTRHDHRTYFHIIVNVNGAKYDEIGCCVVPRTWTAEWDVATGRFTEGWTVEIALPFKSMGLSMPTAGTVWGFNLNRQQWRIPEQSSWATTLNRFHEPMNFGHLFFVPSF
jgi:hypothetical protein